MTTAEPMSAEAAKTLCQEMNAKYPVMVYTMVKRSAKQIPAGSKITNCKVKSVSSTECTLSYVTCKGDACSMPQTTVYRFNPPLASDKVFMLQLQSKICAPNLLWIFTKPLAFLILVVCTLLSIAAMGYGVPDLTDLIEKYPGLDNGISKIFGSARTFAFVLLFMWIFAVIAHFIECFVAYRQCERQLRFSNAVSSQWALLVFMVGWPVFEELQELVEAKRMHAKNK